MRLVHYSNLGRTGLKVSQLILGAARFGELTGGNTADAIVGAALDAGITTFDTADIYNGGRSEEELGRALKKRREAVVLCTKVGMRVGDTEVDHAAAFRPGGLDHAARWRHGISPNDQGLSRVHLLAAIDASLGRLGTDYIDVYQVHKWDDDTPIEETLSALDDLVRFGKVRYIGCSAFAAWQLYRALWTSDIRQFERFACIQAGYNVLSRDHDRELFPACVAESVSVLAFQVLAGGMLSGRYERDAEPASTSRLGSRQVYRARYWAPAVFDAVDRLKAVAEQSGRSMAQLAIGFALAQPAVTAVLFGVSAPEQVAAVVDVVDRPLDVDEVEAVAATSAA